jgi:hypothetical protein
MFCSSRRFQPKNSVVNWFNLFFQSTLLCLGPAREQSHQENQGKYGKMMEHVQTSVFGLDGEICSPLYFNSSWESSPWPLHVPMTSPRILWNSIISACASGQRFLKKVFQRKGRLLGSFCEGNEFVFKVIFLLLMDVCFLDMDLI